MVSEFKYIYWYVLLMDSVNLLSVQYPRNMDIGPIEVLLYKSSKGEKRGASCCTLRSKNRSAGKYKSQSHDLSIHSFSLI